MEGPIKATHISPFCSLQNPSRKALSISRSTTGSFAGNQRCLTKDCLLIRVALCVVINNPFIGRIIGHTVEHAVLQINSVSFAEPE